MKQLATKIGIFTIVGSISFVVLDAMAGSGTIFLAALLTGYLATTVTNTEDVK